MAAAATAEPNDESFDGEEGKAPTVSSMSLDSPCASSSLSPSPYTLYAENYQKLFKRLEQKPPKNKNKPMALLVMSGAFNPPHLGHIHALEAAATYCQHELNMEVAGGVLSLEHDTVVRNKLKRWPQEVITPRHRLRLCQELVKKYAWITVDRWEVTRRAALDYLSVLEHSRKTWNSVGSQFDIKVFLLCDVSDMIKTSPVALQSAGFGAITSCRIEDFDKVSKTVARQVPSWSGIGYVAEDDAMIPNEAVGLLSSSTSIRKLLIAASNESNVSSNSSGGSGGGRHPHPLKSNKTSGDKSQPRKPKLEILRKVLVESAIQYAIVENLGLKMQSKEPWSKEDHRWRKPEQMYMEQTLKIEDDRLEEEKDDALTMRMVEYSHNQKQSTTTDGSPDPINGTSEAKQKE